MKKLSILTTLLVLFSISSFAQNRRGFQRDFQKFKAEKISYLTEALELSPEEAQEFWPIYNEYEKKRWDIMKERHELEKSLRENTDDLSDKECIILTQKLAEFPKRDGELNMEYNKKFLTILSAKKVLNLYISENQFRSTMLRKYKEGHRPEKQDK